TQFDAEALAEVLAHTVVAQHPTADAIADHDHMASDGLAKDQIIKRRDAVQVRGRHAEVRGNIVKALIGDPPSAPLYDFQRIDADGLTSGIVRCLCFNFTDLISAQHHAPPYRSMSASTKSMTPKTVWSHSSLFLRPNSYSSSQFSGALPAAPFVVTNTMRKRAFP